MASTELLATGTHGSLWTGHYGCLAPALFSVTTTPSSCLPHTTLQDQRQHLLFITSWAIPESQEVFVTFPIPHCLCSPKYSLNDAGQPWDRHIWESDLLWDALWLKAGCGWLWGMRVQDSWPLLPSNCAASAQQASFIVDKEKQEVTAEYVKGLGYPTTDI